MSGIGKETDPRPAGAADEATPERADEAAPQETPEAQQAPEGNPGLALQEDPEQVRAERDDYRDRLLRTVAEFDNYRKRVERDRRELLEFGAADLLGELLPVLDDLERALAAAPTGDSASAVAGYRAGVELIQRQLLDLLRKRGVSPIEALGADFDPHVHQAVASEPSDAHRDGEVIEELRRGYKLGERLLRPAMVKVASRG
jgi:molecular chaperone GrpE